MTSKPMLYAVRLPSVLTPETQQGYIFVGVRCPNCETAYSVALPNTPNNAQAIPLAIEWAKISMGDCRSHPAVLYEDSSEQT
jgi:hypothetical protein